MASEHRRVSGGGMSSDARDNKSPRLQRSPEELDSEDALLLIGDGGGVDERVGEK